MTISLFKTTVLHASVGLIGFSGTVRLTIVLSFSDKMALWVHPGKDITGVIARAEKFAGTLRKYE